MPRPREFRIEPLNASHDRTAFCSGVAALDEYLQRQAGQDARRRVAAPFVLVRTQGSILGYYTLSAYSIRLGALPNEVAKRLPRYPLIPATLLGRLAVSKGCHGQGLARLLLMDALHRSWRSTKAVASVGVLVEALDEAARAFYVHHEFIPLLDRHSRLLLPMATIEKVFRAK